MKNCKSKSKTDPDADSRSPPKKGVKRIDYGLNRALIIEDIYDTMETKFKRKRRFVVFYRFLMQSLRVEMC